MPSIDCRFDRTNVCQVRYIYLVNNRVQAHNKDFSWGCMEECLPGEFEKTWIALHLKKFNVNFIINFAEKLNSVDLH